jgi:hypothetical protein
MEKQKVSEIYTERDRLEKANLLVTWRNSLIEGRVKPDRFGQLTHVRESLEYMPMINRIDNELEELLLKKESKNHDEDTTF